MLEKIDIYSLDESLWRLTGKDWMLLTSGGSACEPVDESGKRYNTMTVSWGMGGELWGMPAMTVFVRPQRYTYSFTEQNELFTLSCFGGHAHKMLGFLGKESGRDYADKAREAGLTPVEFADGRATAFEEADYVIICEKKYTHVLEEKDFLDHEVVDKQFPLRDFHRAYVGKVLEAYKRV